MSHKFQSTLSMRRATANLSWDAIISKISIHALHEESDLKNFRDAFQLPISIHALHEESDSRYRKMG